MSDTATIAAIEAILPPFARTMGMNVDHLLGEMPVIAYDFSPAVTGRPGYLHGGALSGLLEIAAIAALRARIGGDYRVKPVNITINFMRGGRELRTYAVGEVIRLGRRVANVEARAWQEDATKPVATVFMNFLLSPASTGQ
ncbi:PaaI family thioesterase [Blastomonas sp.]|uniref:PaaI family thioesterase n=1 Tax=Blastomonas sp. TaxID=1909299 RepID=UPI003592FBE2